MCHVAGFTFNSLTGVSPVMVAKQTISGGMGQDRQAARFVTWLVFDVELDDRTPPDAVWWLSRPLAVIGPLLCTLPVIYVFGRRGRRTPPA